MGSGDGKIIGTTKIIDNGPSSRRWDLVLVSEGYRESELPKFAADAQSFVDRLLATPPFSQLKRAINVYRLDVASSESGADDPKTCPGGTGASPKTFFDATFCSRGVPRLLTVNADAVVAAVNAQAQLRDWNTIVVMVNSSKFGGSGGRVVVFSMPLDLETGIHEIGHAAFGLTDEYDYLLGEGLDKDRDRFSPSPSKPVAQNVTIETDRTKIPWRDLILDSTPIPTTSNPDCRHVDPRTTSPVGALKVGAFEGAKTFHCGIYRPQFTCKMRDMSQPFCAVCQRKIRKDLAPHAFGRPETFGSTWGTGWTSIVPFTAQGRPHFLSYKNPPAGLTKGKVAIDRLRPDASELDTVFEDHWSAGWTSMTPFTLGGQPHLLSYKSGSGSVAIDRFRFDGKGVDSVFGSTWGTGWTSFVPFTLGNQPHFLYYKLATGEVEIGRVRPDGSEVDTIFEDTWSTGWTGFAPLQLRGKPHYLGYKVEGGRMDIDRLRPDGTGSDTVFSDIWEEGWTTLTPFTLAGDQFVLVYKVASGDVAIYHILPAGDSFELIQTFRDTWSLGWTIIVPFVFKGEPHYLAYKLATGSVSIGLY